MNDASSEPTDGKYSSGFDGRECVDLNVEIRGGGCKRPLTGKLLEQAKAARDRILSWEEYLKQQPPLASEEPKNGSP